jgi:LDH2 family malate/lactate/ureidoglycolate dehydrogenase
MVTSATRSMVVPTRAAVPVLGTNPIAFAAPAGATGRSSTWRLQMPNNNIKVYELNGKRLPAGWC